MSNKSTGVLRTQKKTFILFVIGACVISAGFAYLTMSGSEPATFSSTKVELPGDKINPQDIWMSKMENENKMVEQRLKYLENLVLESKKNETEKENENQQLRKEITHMKTELKTAMQTAREQQIRPNQNTDDVAVVSGKSGSFNAISSKDDPFASSPSSGIPNVRVSRPPLKEVVMGRSNKNTFHVDKSIPAGTSVKALLVSSIDATCGVFSSTDPQPVKLRILDDGHLPKEVMAKLKGGLIIASAYADISTERVYMRLERLTKVESSGDFIETSVTGFVSGEDGKFGVRGEVVDKSGRLITNAACSGFFSGVSQFFNTSMISKQYDRDCGANPFGLELLQAGGLQGTSSAFDTLADYYIRRAEQIMPVIQVAAGRVVDITFTHKADLGDLYTQEKVKEIREKSRRDSNG